VKEKYYTGSITVKISNKYGWKDSAMMQQQCEDLYKCLLNLQDTGEIDDLNNCEIEVNHDYKIICSHCGYDWEVDDDGNPQCCDKAQKEIDEQRAKSEVGK
jgi:hypothetical protein